MPEFKIRCEYVRKKETKFYNDREPKEYHYFLLVNPEVIPDKYFAKKGKEPCLIIISDSLVKGNKIKFGESLRGEEHKFIINLGEDKTAKFNAKNNNLMVLKTKDYWENTVKKIGFWDSENYFYEVNKRQKTPSGIPNHSPTKPENENNWGKITLICLSIIMLALLSFLIIRWASKRKK